MAAQVRLWLSGTATAAVVLPLGWFWYDSLLPEDYDLAQMGQVDWGGGPVGEHASMSGHHHGTPVADLVVDPERPADVRETLTVRDDGHRMTVNGIHARPDAAGHRG